MCIRFSFDLLALLIFFIFLNPKVKGRIIEYADNINVKSLCVSSKASLESILDDTQTIVAGRLRQRFGKTRLQLRDGMLSATDQSFNASVLVTAVYKNNTNVPEIITVGTFFIPTETRNDKPGCIDAFYKNSKFIFFLRKLESVEDFFMMSSNPQPFTEKLAYTIYAKRCTNCYAPKVEPIKNHEVRHGEKLSVSCTATGNPLPIVEWIKNGKSLNLVDKSVKVENIKVSDQQVESILDISNLIRIDSGEYRCSASNPLGEKSVSFNLQVSQPEKQSQVLMDTELVECTEENRDFCLNGGQCYMLKADKNVLQCRCSPQYFGDRCHFHIGGLLAYAESGDSVLHHMFKEISHEIITHLSLSIWCGFLVIVGLMLYHIYVQHKTMRFMKERRRSRSISGRRDQSRTGHGSKSHLGSREPSWSRLDDPRSSTVNNNVSLLQVPEERYGTMSHSSPDVSRR